jgi:hypothetical protein
VLFGSKDVEHLTSPFDKVNLDAVDLEDGNVIKPKAGSGAAGDAEKAGVGGGINWLCQKDEEGR